MILRCNGGFAGWAQQVQVQGHPVSCPTLQEWCMTRGTTANCEGGVPPHLPLGGCWVALRAPLPKALPQPGYLLSVATAVP